MKIRWAVFSAVFFVLVTTAGAEELRVVKTTPADGAKDVDPALGKITLVFSGPIKTDGWSLVKAGEGETPEMGDPSFPDSKTCVVPVTLEEWTTYSLGINSATRRGFRSADDENVTVTPLVLTFATGGGKAKEAGKQECADDSGAAKAPAVDATEKAAKKEENPPPPEKKKEAPPEKGKGASETVIFERVQERNESAFSILVPKGWEMAGGIFRVNPMTGGGAGNAIAAKYDFAVKKDGPGSVMARWLPEVLYFDMRNSPAAPMFPAGSNYNGMTVMPLLPAVQFLVKVAFPYAHPQAGNAQLVDQKPLPKLAQSLMQEKQAQLQQMAASFSYDAALVTVKYSEGGTEYEEKMVGAVENYGQLGAGLWGNRSTMFARAPVGQMERWAPVFMTVQNSVKINSQWLMGELKGQQQRGEIALKTQQELNRLDQEIVAHQQKTNAEINNDMYLTLTGQEEYVNPYTKEVETGSNEWNNRWTSEGGQMVYTNDPNYDPNADPALSRVEFRKSEIRPRFPQ